MKRIVSLSIAAMGVMSMSAHAASITNNIPSYPSNSSVKQSVINLYCQISADQFYQSKLILIDTDSAKYDFALTTAHGLQSGNKTSYDGCFIRDSRGQRLNVLDAHIAQDFKPGAPTDWAVLKLDKIKKDAVRRYSVTIIGQDAPKNDETIPVSFPKARGLNFNIQNCHAMASEAVGLSNAKILTHNCRVIKGQSGSPVVVRYENQDLLIGVHIGKAWVYRSPVTKKPEHLGYFRVIDEDMIREVNAAIRSFAK